MAANDLNTVYSTLGMYTVVPVADLSLLLAPINKKGDTRKGSESLGKHAGMVVMADMGAGVYRLVVALGAAAADKWQTVDGSTAYTPV